MKWIKNPSAENHCAYKTIRNRLTNLMRSKIKQTNLNRLGLTPTPKTLNATLKSKKRKAQLNQFAPEAIETNESSRRVSRSDGGGG